MKLYLSYVLIMIVVYFILDRTLLKRNRKEIESTIYTGAYLWINNITGIVFILLIVLMDTSQITPWPGLLCTLYFFYRMVIERRHNKESNIHVESLTMLVISVAFTIFCFIFWGDKVSILFPIFK